MIFKILVLALVIIICYARSYYLKQLLEKDREIEDLKFKSANLQGVDENLKDNEGGKK